MDRMIEAIDNYKVTGVTTTLLFGRYVMQHEAFRSGNFDTHFVQNHFDPKVIEREFEKEATVAALLTSDMWDRDKYNAVLKTARPHKRSNWKAARL